MDRCHIQPDPRALWRSGSHRAMARPEPSAVASVIPIFGDLVWRLDKKATAWPHTVGSNFRRSSTGLNSGYRNWLGLQQRRVCTENLQLTGAKVSTPEFRGNEAKLSRHFKRLISIGNVGVRSLDGQPGIPAFDRASRETREWAGNPGFSGIRFRLWTPALPNLRWKSP